MAGLQDRKSTAPRICDPMISLASDHELFILPLIRRLPTMRIALLHYTQPPVIGGVERVIRDQAKALQTLGHEVSLFTRATWQPLAGYEVVIVHNVFTMPFDVAWTRELREQAAAHPEIRWINWVHDVASVNPYYAHLPWKEADYVQLSRPVPRALNVAVSEVRRQDYLSATGLPAEAVQVVPNGLDFAAVLGIPQRIADLHLWERELVLLHPTRLLRRKNIELGLRVTAALRDAGCDVLYAITGAPDPHQSDGRVYYQELRALTESLNLASHVLFLGEDGALSDDEVRGLYTMADALFFPSTGEGFGLPLLEAALHRLTIFCSDLPVHREVLGERGEYFTHQSKPEEISAQIVHWHQTNSVTQPRRQLWRRHDMVKICQEHLEPLLATANQSS